ncbi:hypothetical protein DFH27DRAFT_569646 [Peziza echinospora]|nr:hypothetical protein DFH27DRAFT_569646 [Peziza echinospora]
MILPRFFVASLFTFLRFYALLSFTSFAYLLILPVYDWEGALDDICVFDVTLLLLLSFYLCFWFIYLVGYLGASAGREEKRESSVGNRTYGVAIVGPTYGYQFLEYCFFFEVKRIALGNANEGFLFSFFLFATLLLQLMVLEVFGIGVRAFSVSLFFFIFLFLFDLLFFPYTIHLFEMGWICLMSCFCGVCLCSI